MTGEQEVELKRQIEIKYFDGGVLTTMQWVAFKSLVYGATIFSTGRGCGKTYLLRGVERWMDDTDLNKIGGSLPVHLFTIDDPQENPYGQ